MVSREYNILLKSILKGLQLLLPTPSKSQLQAKRKQKKPLKVHLFTLFYLHLKLSLVSGSPFPLWVQFWKECCQFLTFITGCLHLLKNSRENELGVEGFTSFAPKVLRKMQQHFC